MAESTQFLESLEHDNPRRPKFTIKRGGYENLEIAFRGQVMTLPMAEVLLFSRRWEADLKSRQSDKEGANRPFMFPYPLMEANLNDPDVRLVRWDVPPPASE